MTDTDATWDADARKTVLKRYLQEAREALVWKLEGLSERDARLPRTGSGTNVLGIVKHCLNVEHGYFGRTFGRTFPLEGLLDVGVFDVDPHADWYGTTEESVGGVLALYRDVWTYADETIDSLPLDGTGRVPWWGSNGDVTLERVMVHVIAELHRHAGHADILRELIDGGVGYAPDDSNMPEDYDWSAYLAKLNDLADRF
jgi:hypothetical protein